MAVGAGSLGAWAAFQTVPVNDIPYAVVTIGIATFLAGFLSGSGGALTGVASVLIGWLMWVVVRLIESWMSGALSATFPDCDPCGFVGYAGRFAIVTAIVVPTFGGLGAISGWLGERVSGLARRARVRDGTRRGVG